MPYLTGEDIVDDVLFRAGEPTDGTSDFQAKVLDYINQAYVEIIAGGLRFAPNVPRQDWSWLYAQKSLTLETVITTGTLAVTKGSATVTFSSAPAASLTGWHIQPENSGLPLIISAHTAAVATATLDYAYPGATNASAQFSAFKIDYALDSAVGTLLSPMRSSDRPEIGVMDPAAMSRSYPLTRIASGTPRAAALIGERTVRFSHKGPTSNYVRVDYAYRAGATLLTDSSSSTPIIPVHHRHILAEAALALLLINKEDTRAPAAAESAAALFKAMAVESRHNAQHRSSPPPGSIITRPNQRSRDDVLRSESGNILG